MKKKFYLCEAAHDIELNEHYCYTILKGATFLYDGVYKVYHWYHARKMYQLTTLTAPLDLAVHLTSHQAAKIWLDVLKVPKHQLIDRGFLLYVGAVVKVADSDRPLNTNPSVQYINNTYKEFLTLE